MDSGDSDETSFGDTATHTVDANSEREWNKMSNQFTNAGYREGITAGKESALQEGFDTGFANVGAPIGRELGNLRGLSAGVLALLESSRLFELEQVNRNELLTEVREIIRGLSSLQFSDLVPPDGEALAHEQEHAELNGNPMDVSAASMDALSQLSTLRRRLENVLETLKFDALLPLPESAVQPGKAL